jgi:ElaA protein
VIDWKLASFAQLSPEELHDILQARAAVFVVEQKCAFQDVDGLDPACWHLMGTGHSPMPEVTRPPRGSLLAYCRLVPPGVKYAEPSIGRVLTSAEARGSGAGRELMREAVGHALRLWPGHAIRIGAQQYLERFYGTYGFARASEPYDEDGIMHIEMVRGAGERNGD